MKTFKAKTAALLAVNGKYLKHLLLDKVEREKVERYKSMPASTAAPIRVNSYNDILDGYHRLAAAMLRRDEFCLCIDESIPFSTRGLTDAGKAERGIK